MALTVYSMGDMPIFTSVLNAVAMVFNSSLFDPTQGAGVVVIGLLLGIIFMILPAMGGAKINPMPFIFALLLFYAGVVPKERLQVEDIYSGQVTAVDNIPLIVALPASLAATLTRAITDKVETAFSTASGSYLAMGAEGFVNPLKLILGLRDPNQTMRSFPYLSQSITEYVKYCAPTDPVFSTKQMSSSASIIDYLAGLNVAGIMTYWDTTHTMGYGISCAEGQTFLKRDSGLAIITTDTEALLKSNTAGEYAKSNNGATLGASVAGLNQAYNSVTAGILGNMQTSQQFMVNAIAMTPTKQGVDCINQPTGPNMSDCMSNVIQREAAEKQNVDSAAQAGIFTKTMIPGMNLLLALFYSFSPIVIAIAFMAGPHGIKMVLSFLLFGVWTQSWMPIAAVINYMIQMQTQYAFSAFPATGFTMENYMQFYSVLTMKVGMASTMMAMVPMISMALLSGSMTAMEKLATATSAKDYTDENKVAPSAGSNDAVVKNGSLLSSGSATEVNRVDSQIAGGKQAVTNKDIDVLGKSDNSSTMQIARASAAKSERATRESMGENIAHDFTTNKAENRGKDYSDGLKHAISSSLTKESTAQIKEVMSRSDVMATSQSDQENLSVALGLKALGMGAGAEKTIATSTNKQLASSILNSSDFTNTQKMGYGDMSTRDFSKTLKTSLTSGKGSTASDSLSQNIDRSVVASNALTDTETFGQSNASKQDYAFSTLGSTLEKSASNGGPGTEGEASNFIDGILSPEKKKDYESEVTKINAAQKASGVYGAPGQNTGARLLALQRIDPNNYIKALALMNLGGGVSAHPAGEFSNLPKQMEGRTISDLNKPITQQGDNTERAVIKSVGAEGEIVKHETAASHRLGNQTGANTAAVSGQAAVANTNVTEATANQDNIGKGTINNKKLAAEHEDRNAAFIQMGVGKGLLNSDGKIAGFNNVREVLEQYSQFETNYPAAAAALSFLPVGRAVTVGKALNTARVAAGAPLEAAKLALAARKAELATSAAHVAGHNAPTALTKVGGKEAAIKVQQEAVTKYQLAAKEVEAQAAALKSTLASDKKIVALKKEYDLAVKASVASGTVNAAADANKQWGSGSGK